MKVFRLLVILLLLAGCGTDEPDGFERLSHGISMRLHTIGDGSYQPKALDHVIIRSSFPRSRNIPDSVLSMWEGVRSLKLTYDVKKGGVQYAITRLAAGDSASFLLPASAFIKDAPQEVTWEMNIMLLAVFNPDSFIARNRRLEKFEEELYELEQKEIDAYAAQHFPGAEPLAGGWYFIEKQKGRGPLADTGDVVTVHYSGRFMDGTLFDNTRESSIAVEFQLGSEGQVVRGMGLALARMREGGKAIIILPSHLAFGNKGSSTGIIPPDASLIYELEIINIK